MDIRIRNFSAFGRIFLGGFISGTTGAVLAAVIPLAAFGEQPWWMATAAGAALVSAAAWHLAKRYLR